jgi:hypothetical protein
MIVRLARAVAGSGPDMAGCCARRWRRVTTRSARLCLWLIQIARALVHVLYTLGVR